MEQKEIRLNAGKRKSLTNDYRRHCESLSTELKDQYNQAREECFAYFRSVLEEAKKSMEGAICDWNKPSTLAVYDTKGNLERINRILDKALKELDDN